MLVMTFITIEIEMIVLSVQAQGSIIISPYGLILIGIDVAIIIVWTIFIILSIIRGFKSKPTVRPVKTLICLLIVLALVWLGILLTLSGGIVGAMARVGGTYSDPQIIVSMILTGIGLGVFMFPGTVLSLCVSNKNKKILKNKVA